MSYVVPRRGVGFAGFGAVTFDAQQVWSDWQAGGTRGNNAASAIQAALNQIGYGPISVDGQFGAGSQAAWNKFAAANGVPGTWPTEVGVLKLGDQVAQGGNQGGGTVVDYHIEDGKYVPGSAPGTQKAGLGTLGMIGIVALIAIGGAALLAKKKKQGTSSSTAMQLA